MVMKESKLEKISLPRCNLACPAGINVQKYIGEIAKGKFREAWYTIVEENPLPGLSGYLCTRPCEYNCYLRYKNGEQVLIKELKRFVSEWFFEEEAGFPTLNYPVKWYEKVGVFGEGISALIAVWILRKEGIKVDLFTDLDNILGPWYKLGSKDTFPKELFKKEAERILEDKNVALFQFSKDELSDSSIMDRFKKDTYSALILAYDSSSFDFPFPLENKTEKNQKNILSSLEAIEILEREGSLNIENAIVIYGGDLFTILTSIIIKSKTKAKVLLLYPYSFERLPCDSFYIEKAIKIGVDFLCDQLITEARDYNDKIELKAVSHNGIQSKFIVDKAVLKTWRVNNFPKALSIVNNLGNIEVDENFESSLPKVFALGECVTGPKNIIETIAHVKYNGLRIIYSIKGEKFNSTQVEPFPILKEREEIDFEPKKKLSSYEFITNTSFARREAERCLRCGPCYLCDECSLICVYRFWYDRESKSWIRGNRDHKEKLYARVLEDRCIGCGNCVDICNYKVINVLEKKDGKRVAYINKEFCKGCGWCKESCLYNAIELVGIEKWI